jgi:hypothetical protein
MCACHRESNMKARQPWIRRSQRVIRMVSELHRMGYQKLRFMPFEYPLAFRVYVGPVSIFSRKNGAHIAHLIDGAYAGYSSASDNVYFGWTDATGDNAYELGKKFIERFPDIAARGLGRDWRYAGWLSELLSVFEEFPARLPIVQAEYMEPSGDDLTALPLRCYDAQQGIDEGKDMAFPLPPPGRLSSA